MIWTSIQECIIAISNRFLMNSVFVHTADDIEREIGKQMEQFEDKKKGIPFLSGGMDSAIVASIFTWFGCIYIPVPWRKVSGRRVGSG